MANATDTALRSVLSKHYTFADQADMALLRAICKNRTAGLLSWFSYKGKANEKCAHNDACSKTNMLGKKIITDYLKNPENLNAKTRALYDTHFAQKTPQQQTQIRTTARQHDKPWWANREFAYQLALVGRDVNYNPDNDTKKDTEFPWVDPNAKGKSCYRFFHEATQSQTQGLVSASGSNGTPTTKAKPSSPPSSAAAAKRRVSSSSSPSSAAAAIQSDSPSSSSASPSVLAPKTGSGKGPARKQVGKTAAQKQGNSTPASSYQAARASQTGSAKGRQRTRGLIGEAARAHDEQEQREEEAAHPKRFAGIGDRVFELDDEGNAVANGRPYKVSKTRLESDAQIESDREEGRWAADMMQRSPEGPDAPNIAVSRPGTANLPHPPQTIMVNATEVVKELHSAIGVAAQAGNHDALNFLQSFRELVHERKGVGAWAIPFELSAFRENISEVYRNVKATASEETKSQELLNALTRLKKAITDTLRKIQ